MASETRGQLIAFICDECGEEFEISTHDWKAAWAAAKQDGWRCFQDDEGEGIWSHRCPGCRGR